MVVYSFHAFYVVDKLQIPDEAEAETEFKIISKEKEFFFVTDITLLKCSDF